MTLAEAVFEQLTREQVPVAVIGAGAMAVHGVSRATLDLDFLTPDARVLRVSFWTPLAPPARADVRPGDSDDPLLGVVRLTAPGERDVDVIVGRHAWQTGIVDRALPAGAGGGRVPVARAADIILLKLYAGGLQDRWDIAQLLAAGDRDELEREVTSHLTALPESARSLWDRIAAELADGS